MKKWFKLKQVIKIEECHERCIMSCLKLLLNEKLGLSATDGRTEGSVTTCISIRNFVGDGIKTHKIKTSTNYQL
jgi:hypothetical protein